MSDAPWRRWFPGPGHTRRYWAACLLLTLFAAALRFNGLGEDGLTESEFRGALNARGSIEDVLENTRWMNSRPILYPLILWGVQMIENSPFSIRVIPAVASTLAVACLALLLPIAGIKRSTAFGAAVLASISEPAILLARDGARHYSMETLLVTIILTIAFIYLRGKGKYPFFIILFISPLLSYGVPFVCAVILATIFLKIWWEKRNKKALIDAFNVVIFPAIFLALGSILTWNITLQYHDTGHGLNEPDNALAYYRGELSDIGAILEFAWGNFFRLLDYHVSNFAIVMLVTVATAFMISNKFRSSEITVIFFLSMMTSVTTAILILYPSGNVIQTLFWSPLVFIMFSHSLSTIIERIPKQGKTIRVVQAGVIILIVTVVIVESENAVSRSIRRLGHPDSLVSTLNELKKQGDIVVLGNFMELTMHFYYPDTAVLGNYHDRQCDCPGSIIGLFRGTDERMWFIGHGEERNSISVIDAISATDGVVVRNVFDHGLQLYLIESTDITQTRQHFIDRGELPDVAPDELMDPIIIMQPYEIYREGRHLIYLKPDADSHGTCVEQDAPSFFLHVEPVNASDLPADRGSDTEFENLDFIFQHGILRIDGFCFAVKTLPEYDVKRITTGQFTRDGRLWTRSVSFTGPALSAASLDGLDEPLLTQHPWKVHDMGKSLVYVNAECADLDREAPFFLHVYPVDADDLPEHRREWGFENLDFDFAASVSFQDGERCAAARELPDWPIHRISTGQYTDEGARWTGEFDWSGNGRAAE